MLLKLKWMLLLSGMGWVSVLQCLRATLVGKGSMRLSIRVHSRVQRLLQCSLAAQLDKPNGKQACAGKCLVHQLDAVTSQFLKHLWSQASPKSYQHYVAGCYTGKSRVATIMQRCVVSDSLDLMLATFGMLNPVLMWQMLSEP